MSFSEWKEAKLEEIAEVIDSLHKTPQYTENGYPMIRVKDLNEGYLNLENTLKVDIEVFKEFTKRYIPQVGDIIVSRVGSYGIMTYVNKKEAFCLGQNTAIINPKIDSKYLFYYLVSPLIKHQIETKVVGTTQKTLSLKNINALKVKYPLLQEQRAIANILSSLDEKIELNNEMNKTLEEMAQALFKRWFVDFEFPNENGEPYKSSGGEMVDSELGMIPKGYLISTLDEMCNLSAGGDKPKVFSKSKSEECNIPIYSNGIDNEGLYGFTDKAKVFEKSVTVSARGTIGFICLRQEPYVPIVRLISVIPNKGSLSSEYLYHWLKSMNIQATGTTQQQLTVPQFKKAKILIPTLDIMKSFTMKVESMVAQIEANKLENENLSSIRDTLLPKLMSGEIRVTDIQN